MYLAYYSKFQYKRKGLVGGIGRDEIHVPIPLIKILKLSPIVFFLTQVKYIHSTCNALDLNATNTILFFWNLESVKSALSVW